MRASVSVPLNMLPRLRLCIFRRFNLLSLYSCSGRNFVLGCDGDHLDNFLCAIKGSERSERWGGVNLWALNECEKIAVAA
jgi:hypothetical protein